MADNIINMLCILPNVNVSNKQLNWDSIMANIHKIALGFKYPESVLEACIINNGLLCKGKLTNASGLGLSLS